MWLNLPKQSGRNVSKMVASRRMFRPSLEVLEDRRVPATIVVDTLIDHSVFNTTTSLRLAIDEANSDPATDDVITFAPGLTGTIQLTRALPDLTGNLEIRGPGAGLLTVLRQTGGDYRIFAVASSATVTLSGLTIANGSAISLLGGGGIANEGTLTLSDCILSDNYATQRGGISNLGRLTVRNSTISGNRSAITGGGIHNTGTIQLTNSTLSGNQSDGDGGGILCSGFETLTNVTITTNIADADNNNFGAGGGIRVPSGTVTLHNTLVAGNFKGNDAADNISGAADPNSSFSLVGESTGLGGITHGVNGNLVGIDPMLGPLSNNGGPTPTHALLAGSPALNKGLAPGAPGTDQRGFGRFGAPDIGAFEVQLPPQPNPPPIAQPSPQPVELTVKKVKKRTRVEVVANGVVRSRFFPFGTFTGAVQILRGDFNGDSLLDVRASATINGKKRTRTFIS